MRKDGTAWTGQSNVPYFQTHNQDGTFDCPVPAVPCFLVENTEQLGRDNPMSRIFRHTAGTGLSRVFNEKTRDSRDRTMSRILKQTAGTGLYCPVFSTRKHGTAGTGRNFFLVPSRSGVPDFSIEQFILN